MARSGKTPQPERGSGKQKQATNEKSAGKLRVEGSGKMPPVAVSADTEPQRIIGQGIVDRHQPGSRWMVIVAILLLVLAATAAALYYGGVVKI